LALIWRTPFLSIDGYLLWLVVGVTRRALQQPGLHRVLYTFFRDPCQGPGAERQWSEKLETMASVVAVCVVRTPGPPPFSSMNSTPAPCGTATIAASVAASPECMGSFCKRFL
jgi:hypothetical protein